MINADRTGKAERKDKEEAARTALNFESLRRNVWTQTADWLRLISWDGEVEC